MPAHHVTALQSIARRSTLLARCRAPNRKLFFSTTTTRSRADEKDSPPPPKTSPLNKSSSDDYYSLLLLDPQPDPSSPTSPTSIPAAALPPKNPSRDTIIFPSKLIGPTSRRERSYTEDPASLENRPKEPDNCCMSGCVNCVWDGYREELEDWVRARDTARKAAAGRPDTTRTVAGAPGTEEDGYVGGVGDEDWMGSGDWAKVESEMDGIPVGIREFMMVEKRLKMEREKRMKNAG